MSHLRSSWWLACLVALAAGLLLPAGAGAARAPGTIDGRYIVVFEDAVDRPSAVTDRLERDHGFQSRSRYRSALKGFAATLSGPADEIAAAVADDALLDAPGGELADGLAPPFREPPA